MCFLGCDLDLLVVYLFVAKFTYYLLNMIGRRSVDLPLYEGEVPESEEIPRVDANSIEMVERYIAFHFEEFDYDFRNDTVSDNDKKIREIKVIQAICEVLDLSPRDPVVPKYLEAILKQLKKGIVFKGTDKPLISGAIMRGAQANDFRASKRGGI